MLKHIVVAIDGSPSSERALAFAQKLLGPTGGGPDLTVLLVLEPPLVATFAPLEGFAVLAPPHPTPDHIAVARAAIDRLTRDLGAEQMHSRVEIGHPAETICRVAEEVDADLVIVGARGANPAVQWLLGSVSERVTRHCTRPVTVVR